ncbi:MAG: NUDIX domain-containing protein [Desulfarculus sp.]|nr:NUDIX domain-containing protein [Desulfarculus sp.]
MTKDITPRHCLACGGMLTRPLPSPGGPPFYCAACGLPVYHDPKVAVAGVVTDQAGRVWLLRRAQRDQAHGRWILPGGHVDRGEELTQAVRREVAEETGLQAELRGLVGVYSYPGNPVVLIVYRLTSQPGQPRPSREALELRPFAPADIPWDRLGYVSTGQALRDALDLNPSPAPEPRLAPRPALG